MHRFIIKKCVSAHAVRPSKIRLYSNHLICKSHRHGKKKAVKQSAASVGDNILFDDLL